LNHATIAWFSLYNKSQAQEKRPAEKSAQKQKAATQKAITKNPSPKQKRRK